MADPNTVWTPRDRRNKTTWLTQNLTSLTTSQLTALDTSEMGPSGADTVWTDKP